jgi:hypothetical protein
MTPEEKSRAIGQWHNEWAAKWAATVKPDPKYANRKRTMYPETAVDLSVSVQAEDEYWAGVARILGQSAAVVTPKVVKAGRAQVDMALTYLDNLPDIKPGLIASPWPVVDRPILDDELWRESKITTIPIDALHASQPFIRRERVEYYILNPGAIEEKRRAFANVYDQDGRLVIVDGHHRLAALWMLGSEDALVWLLREGT